MFDWALNAPPELWKIPKSYLWLTKLLNKNVKSIEKILKYWNLSENPHQPKIRTMQKLANQPAKHVNWLFATKRCYQLLSSWKSVLELNINISSLKISFISSWFPLCFEYFYLFSLQIHNSWVTVLKILALSKISAIELSYEDI